MSMKHDVRTRRGGLRRLGAILALALLGALPVAAQISTASVEVHVADTDGGALPGVTVTLENLETGLTRVAVTGEAGDASLSALAPGSYRASFERLDVIVEGFNVLDNTNYDVSSIDSAELLSGPTLANPALPFRPNPNFGHFRATLPGREIQLGLRWVF
jgi:hypothetical protein